MSGERAGEEVQAVGFTHEVVEQTVEAALNAIASSDSVGPMESRPKTAGAPFSESARSTRTPEWIRHKERKDRRGGDFPFGAIRQVCCRSLLRQLTLLPVFFAANFGFGSNQLVHRAESKFCAPRVKMRRMAFVTAFVL